MQYLHSRLKLEKEVILSVQNLTKEYAKNDSEKIEALSQISFNLHKGEILGVIGKNGAGKSTLLKVLSEITLPTTGRVEYEGTLTSIIEIGTGFHPDLSGKDNVFLNANLLGQSKKEISLIYDDIVEFSGLSDFMDMPVKHFSSGMYLRLAFTVAFYSKIDILLLDEVIAVGDTEFRRKCYQKIRDLNGSGVAIILVSHSMENIQEFCNTCLLLQKGELLKIGKPTEVIEYYLEELDENLKSTNSSQKGPISYLYNLNELKVKHFNIKEFTIRTVKEAKPTIIDVKDEISIELIVENNGTDGSFQVTYELINMNDIRLFMDSFALRENFVPLDMSSGKHEIKCTIPSNLLNKGYYYLGIILCHNGVFEKHLEKAARFRIDQAKNNPLAMEINALICPKLGWEINSIKT